MSLGSIFVGLAVAVIAIAYIVRPFRAVSSAASGAAVSRTDKLIEAWIRTAPVAAPAAKDNGVSAIVDVPELAVPPSAVAPSAAAPSGSVNFCPQCGRRVTSDYRFCPGCGALLPHEEGTPSGGVA